MPITTRQLALASAILLFGLTFASKKLISKDIAEFIGNFLNFENEQKMKMTDPNWNALETYENIFPNAGPVKLFRHKEEKTLFWSDIESLVLDEDKKQIETSLQSEDVWNKLGDWMDDALVDDMFRQGWLEEEFPKGILFWKMMMYKIAENIELNRKLLHSGGTLLQLAAHIDAVDSIIKLLERGQLELSSGVYQAIWYQNEASLQILLERATDINAYININAEEEEYFSSTFLLVAAQRGSAKIVEMLLEKGADIGAKDDDGASALHIAASEENEFCCEVLLKYKPNVDARDKNGETPLMFAACSNSPKILKLLLDNGADVNAQNDFGKTPLMFASLEKSEEYCPCHNSVCEEILKVLLKEGADVDKKDKGNETALHYLVMNGSSNWMESAFMCKLLLEKNPKICDQRLLQLAAENGKICLWRLLMRAGYAENFEISDDLKVLSALYFYQNK